MFPLCENIVSKSFPNTKPKMELIGKRVILSHSNVRIGTRHMGTPWCPINLQKMLMLNLESLYVRDISNASTIHCALSTSKLLSVNASLTLSKPD